MSADMVLTQNSDQRPTFELRAKSGTQAEIVVKAIASELSPCKPVVPFQAARKPAASVLFGWNAANLKLAAVTYFAEGEMIGVLCAALTGVTVGDPGRRPSALLL